MGLDICLGALMVGRRFLRFGPLRREILLRSRVSLSSDMIVVWRLYETTLMARIGLGGLVSLFRFLVLSFSSFRVFATGFSIFLEKKRV
jgi:hypothetical protein